MSQRSIYRNFNPAHLILAMIHSLARFNPFSRTAYDPHGHSHRLNYRRRLHTNTPASPTTFSPRRGITLTPMSRVRSANRARNRNARHMRARQRRLHGRI